MPEQVCLGYDSTCENCLLGRARPHNFKKWSSPTGWCRPIEQQIPIEEGRTEKDWLMGGKGNYNQDILVVDGQWQPFLIAFELQHNQFGDVYGCVSFSAMNALELIFKRRYNEEMNWSDRKVVVGSGTVPQKGNSMNAVAEYIRTAWTVLEPDYPYSPTMTLTEYYQSIPQNIIDKALIDLQKYEVSHAWLPRENNDQAVFCSPATLMEAITYSPIQVCVGPANERNGIIYFPEEGGSYYHAVTIIGYVKDKNWVIFDSESNQIQIYDWNYKFGYPKIYSLKKKETRVFYKEFGKSPLYQKGIDGMYYPIKSGEVFKKLFGEYSTNQIIEMYIIHPSLKSSKSIDLT